MREVLREGGGGEGGRPAGAVREDWAKVCPGQPRGG